MSDFDSNRASPAAVSQTDKNADIRQVDIRKDVLWIMTRAEIDALRARIARLNELLDNSRSVVDRLKPELLRAKALLAEAQDGIVAGWTHEVKAYLKENP